MSAKTTILYVEFWQGLAWDAGNVLFTSLRNKQHLGYCVLVTADWAADVFP